MTISILWISCSHFDFFFFIMFYLMDLHNQVPTLAWAATANTIDWLKQQKFGFSLFWRLESTRLSCLPGGHLMRALPLGYQVFLLCTHMDFFWCRHMKHERLPSSSCKTTNPIRLWLFNFNYLLKALSLNIITLWVSASTYESGGEMGWGGDIISS